MLDTCYYYFQQSFEDRKGIAIFSGFCAKLIFKGNDNNGGVLEQNMNSPPNKTIEDHGDKKYSKTFSSEIQLANYCLM